jgi:hypothetical protein
MDVEEDFKKNVPVMCVLQVWDAVQYLLVNDMVVCLICQGNRGFCICSIQRRCHSSCGNTFLCNGECNKESIISRKGDCWCPDCCKKHGYSKYIDHGRNKPNPNYCKARFEDGFDSRTQ